MIPYLSHGDRLIAQLMGQPHKTTNYSWNYSYQQDPACPMGDFQQQKCPTIPSDHLLQFTRWYCCNPALQQLQADAHRGTCIRRLWLFSTCAYKLRLQESTRLTDNVRLTSGIIVATPSMRKYVIAKRVIVNVEQMTRTEDDKRPSVRRLYFSSRKCDPRPPYFQRDMDSKNRRDCTSSTRSKKPS